MKQFRSALVTGMLVCVPLLATINILLWFVKVIDSSARNFMPPALLPFDFSGLGVILALAFVLVTGALTQNYVGNWLVSLFDTAIRKIAIVGGIYGGIKKFLETILNPRSDQFKEAVLVEFPRSGVYSIGFRTGSPDHKITRGLTEARPGAQSQQRIASLINVFVPCTPNPTSGFYLLIPEEDVIPLDLTVQDAFKIVISMGIVHTDEIFPQKEI